MMSKSYSIAEARDNFAAMVRDIEERVSVIELTRRGKPVAVLLSVGEYRRLSGQAGSATARYLAGGLRGASRRFARAGDALARLRHLRKK
jgi:prevent-host-death family protein